MSISDGLYLSAAIICLAMLAYRPFKKYKVTTERRIITLILLDLFIASIVSVLSSFFEEVVKKDMLAGKRVIIAAHGNSLRALVKYFDNLSKEEIIGVNIPTGVPLVYEFDEKFNVLNKYYLGDQEALQAKMNAVANQGKKK